MRISEKQFLFSAKSYICNNEDKKKLEDYSKNVQEKMLYYRSLSDGFLRNENYYTDEVIEQATKYYGELINSNATKNAKYLFCPHCKKSHRIYEYLIPKTSIKELIKKYEYLFGIIHALDNYNYYITCKEDYIPLLIGYKGQNNNEKYMYKEVFRLPKTESIFKKELDEISNMYIPTEEFKHDENGLIQMCPSCGERIRHKKGKEKIYNYSDDYKYIFLTREPSWTKQNIIDYDYNIFIRENKVICSIIRWQIFPNIYGKLHITPINIRLVFNTKTGQSYYLRPINMHTKNPVDGNEVRLQNITYKTMKVPCFLTKNVANDIIKAICEQKGIAIISVEEILGYNNTFLLTKECEKTNDLMTIPVGEKICKHIPPLIDVVNAVNRYSNLGIPFINNYCYFNSWLELSNDLKRNLYMFQNSQNDFIKYMKKEKIKNKKIISLIANNPMNLVIYNNLKNIGINNPDSLIKFIESKDNRILKLLDLINDMHSNYKYSFNEFNNDYISEKSETELVNKILSCMSAILYRDTCNMYHSIKENCDLTKKAKIKLFKGNLKEIHDRLIEVSNTLGESSFYIPYEKSDMHLNCSCGNYYFELAKTSLDMKKVGAEMHICVGSYARYAFSRNCIIIFMKNKVTNKTEACIEIYPDKKNVRQVKDYCNTHATQEKWSALKSYFAYQKIKTDDSTRYGHDDCECFKDAEIIGIQERKDNDYKIFDEVSDVKFEDMIIESNVLQDLGVSVKETAINNGIYQPFMNFW